MNKYLLIFFLSLTLLCSCSDDNAPADANENFITSVILTVGNDSYEAVINDGTITITVPYTVSLDGAVASFAYTPSAKIYPNPQEITDWNEERVFRVVSYNGDERQYTYTVIKDEIREDGDVVLKNAADITAFAEKGVSVINGNLTIGTESGEEITDIAALDNLKEVTGVISILDSYKGTDLTGLDNIKSVGGIKIGSSENYSNIPLYLFSLNSLEKVSGDINIYNNTLELVDFKNLPTVEGSVNIASANLKSIQAEKLTDIMGDFIISCDNNNAPGGTIKELSLPMLSNIGGTLSGTRFAELNAISFPALKTAGAIRFETLPIELSKISFPEIETINGDLVFTSQYAYQAIGSSYSGNSSLQSFEGFDKLKNIKGELKISFFTATTNIPNIENATIHNVYLEYLSGITSLNMKATQFDNTDSKSKVELYRMRTSKIIGHETMDCEFRFTDMYYMDSKGLPIFENIEEVNGLYIYSMQTFSDEYTANLKKINGNLHFDMLYFALYGNKISFPNLTDVKGYVYIGGASQFDTIDLNMPLLESVGGQMYVGGSGLNNYDLSSLKTVSVGTTTYDLDVEESSDMFFNEFGSGYGLNLHLTTPGKSLLPSLKTVGGNGLRLNITDMFIGNPITSVELNSLETVTNSLVLESTVWGDASVNKISFSNLNNVERVSISSLSALADFTTFGHLFTAGKISSESNWTVTGCLYNPSFDDMKAGKYKPSESAMTNLAKTIESRRAAVKRLSRSLKK